MAGHIFMKAAVLVAAALIIASAAPGAEADDEAGHAIAEKFSGPPLTNRDPAEASRSEEEWMLEQARKEAKEREAREAAEREAREAEDQRLAVERESAERQAREAAERKAAEEKALQADEERLAREAEEARHAAAERQRALEAEREEEGRRLTEKIKRLEAVRAAQRQAVERQATEATPPAPALPATPPAPAASPEAGSAKRLATEAAPQAAPSTDPLAAAREVSGGKPPPALTEAPTGTPAVSATRVTVLLILEPKKTGIRRFGKATADPVLCSGKTCWVSAGPGRDATQMPRGRALGPGNTLGPRAASCNHSLACVYRAIELGAEQATLQPIDLRIMRHDRRPELAVRADRSCDFDGVSLFCGTIYRAASWRAWVVPEPVAAKAGPAVLKATLDGALTAGRSADAVHAVAR